MVIEIPTDDRGTLYISFYDMLITNGRIQST